MPRCFCIKTTHLISKTLFGIPQDEVKKKIWENSFGILLKKNNHICANHFKMCDVKSTWESGEGSNKYTIDLVNQPGLLEFYQLILQNIKKLTIPINWFVNIENDKSNNSVISFHKLGPLVLNRMRYVEKQLVITKDSTTIHINGKVLKSEIYIQNIKHLETELKLCDKIKCCHGAVSSYDFSDVRQSFGTQYVEYNGQWRHSKCLIILQDNDSDCNLCIWCKRLLFSIRKKMAKLNKNKQIRTYYSPNKKRAHQKILKTANIIRKKHSYAIKLIYRLQNRLNRIQNELKNIETKQLEQLLENSSISHGQHQSSIDT